MFEGAAYRNETVNNLDTMLFITSAGNTDGAKGKDETYLSDFNMSDGINLTSPIITGVPDSTSRAVGESIGSNTITMTDDPAPDVVPGLLIFDDGGNELGKIASIAGRVLTLESPLATAITADSRLTFVVDNTPDITGGKLLNVSTRGCSGNRRRCAYWRFRNWN